jgi:hypothetical protein
MLAHDDETLVDAVYEAAIIPELWPETLKQLSSAAGAYGTCLFTTCPSSDDLRQIAA